MALSQSVWYHTHPAPPQKLADAQLQRVLHWRVSLAYGSTPTHTLAVPPLGVTHRAEALRSVLRVYCCEVNSSLLGVPGSIDVSVRCPVLAAATIAAMTWLGVAVGCCSRYTATAPVTCGAAILQVWSLRQGRGRKHGRENTQPVSILSSESRSLTEGCSATLSHHVMQSSAATTHTVKRQPPYQPALDTFSRRTTSSCSVSAFSWTHYLVPLAQV